MSNDLSEAIIWQRHSHTAVPDVYLAPSNHIRQTISEYASLHGMTAGRIKRRESNSFRSGYLLLMCVLIQA